VTKKSNWIKAYDGRKILKRKYHVAVEAQLHTLKRESVEELKSGGGYLHVRIRNSFFICIQFVVIN